jgi:hypothetical protein
MARALLAAAMRRMAELGVERAEGYPVRPPASGARIPPGFAYTGTRSLSKAQALRSNRGARHTASNGCGSGSAQLAEEEVEGQRQDRRVVGE